jgi:hypothetical protein
VPGTTYPWHVFTDGQATFPTLGPGGGPDGGWILVANSEVPSASGGGASSISFDQSGKITGARRILGGTNLNCAGGPTPWGTWISCEETDAGLAWECDPTGVNAQFPRPRPALGTFKHEAVCVDPLRERLYLTEDQGDGLFYRFTPADYPDLTPGVLEAAKVDARGAVTWARVPNPNQVVPTPTRKQVAGATPFDGGEGIWFDSGVGLLHHEGRPQGVGLRHRPRAAGDDLRPRARRRRDAAAGGRQRHRLARGDVYICEDGDNFEICLITPDRQVADVHAPGPGLHAGTAAGNESVGVVFDPSGQRMYFGVQRSFGQGVVYEVTGPVPCRHRAAPAGVVAGGAAAAAGVLAPTGEGRLTSADRIAPGVRLRTARSISAANLSRRGLALTFELDEPPACRSS